MSVDHRAVEPVHPYQWLHVTNRKRAVLHMRAHRPYDAGRFADWVVWTLCGSTVNGPTHPFQPDGPITFADPNLADPSIPLCKRCVDLAPEDA